MEGLIPYVYKAILQYRNREHKLLGSSKSWYFVSPSGSSYIKLPNGDSKPYTTPPIRLSIPFHRL
ncbi:hypothetical protein ZOSMA_28G00580 [Zostera marina]|uniref:Uncharacterized protein n=1 Tax=Zostera marina TaxID=29655 RepID=A0A0K9PCB3_ZOSMR|nr:hypothetical protein ZOSMA_28G00580 [Zostera marina]